MRIAKSYIQAVKIIAVLEVLLSVAWVVRNPTVETTTLAIILMVMAFTLLFLSTRQEKTQNTASTASDA